MQPIIPSTAGQPGPIGVRAESAPPTVRGPWHTRVDPTSLGVASELSDGEFRVLTVLEAHASERRPWCWPSLDRVGESARKKTRALQLILDRLERSGWVLRVRGSQNQIIGFVLLRRLWGGSVAADSAERLAEAVASLRGRKSMRPQTARGAEVCALGAQEVAPPRAQDLAHPIEEEPSHSEPANGNDRSLASVSPAAGEEQTPDPEPASPRARGAIVGAKAAELHRRLYEGMPPGVAAADWSKWERNYCGIARQVLNGAVPEAWVAAAVAVARRPNTKCRGRRFSGEIRSYEENGGPKEAAPPAPPPADATPDPGLGADVARCLAALKAVTPRGVRVEYPARRPVAPGHVAKTDFCADRTAAEYLGLSEPEKKRVREALVARLPLAATVLLEHGDKPFLSSLAEAYQNMKELEACVA